jgi:hypothetical protein
VIATLLLLLFDPVVAEVDVGEGELDDVLYGNGAEVMLTNKLICVRVKLLLGLNREVL